MNFTLMKAVIICARRRIKREFCLACRVLRDNIAWICNFRVPSKVKRTDQVSKFV